MPKNQQSNQLTDTSITNPKIQIQHTSKSADILDELESLNTFSIIIVVVFILSTCLLMSCN